MIGRVLSLCDHTTVMVQPWLAAGFEAVCVDLQNDDEWRDGGALHAICADITTWTPENTDYDIVFAFPPCTHLANSGARWFKDKGLAALIEGLTLVERCRLICEAVGAPWMLENPVGQLATYWRKPDHTFNPSDFGGWVGDGIDAYTKRTCLWTGNGFVFPQPSPVAAIEGSKMHRMAPGPERANLRSATPAGFAEAVFQANIEWVKAAAS